jgi:hypothetical protein
MPEYQPNKVTSGRKSTSKRSRPPPPVHLPKLIKKPEPIPVTLDQFQAVQTKIFNRIFSSFFFFSS